MVRIFHILSLKSISTRCGIAFPAICKKKDGFTFELVTGGVWNNWGIVEGKMTIDINTDEVREKGPNQQIWQHLLLGTGSIDPLADCVAAGDSVTPTSLYAFFSEKNKIKK